MQSPARYSGLQLRESGLGFRSPVWSSLEQSIKQTVIFKLIQTLIMATNAIDRGGQNAPN